jgi:putative ABC transport system permease protein
VRSPGYVAVVVIGLGVGMTATMSMLSALSAAFNANPVGVQDRHSLAQVRVTFAAEQNRTSVVFSPEEFATLRHHGPQVQSLLATAYTRVTIRGGEAAASVRGQFVSGNYFGAMGTSPVIGRLLSPTDDVRGAAPVAVIGHEVWQRQFLGRTDVLGQAVTVSDRQLVVVGVAPEGFAGPRSPEPRNLTQIPQVWLPLSLAEGWRTVAPPGDRPIYVFARLMPGITREEAAHAFFPATAALQALNPASGSVTFRLTDPILGAGIDPLTILGIITAFLVGPLCLLLIGCLNVANLRLARATARGRELALRTALGASRGQIVRLLLIETTVLMIPTIALSWLGTSAIIRLFSHALTSLPVTIDWRVGGLVVVVGVGVLCVSGLAPAWLIARRASAVGLRQTPQSGGAAHARLRNVLVVTQVAIAVVLLATGSMFARSFQVAASAYPGVIDELAVARLDLASQGYDAPRATQFIETVRMRLAQNPRFASVGVGAAEFLGGWGVAVRVAGQTSSREVTVHRITPGWFDALGMRLIAGRTFADGEPRPMAVLNDAARQLLLPEGSPLGLRLEIRSYAYVADADAPTLSVEPVDVIGVVTDVLPSRRNPTRPDPQIYLPLRSPMPVAVTIVVRGSNPEQLAGELTRAIATAGPVMPYTSTMTGRGLVFEDNLEVQQMSLAVGALAVVSLALAAAGLFAVLAYAVSLRSREVGIRMALGARRSDVTRMVLRHALTLTAIGGGVGFAIVVPLAEVTRAALQGVSPFDPLALGPAAVLLIVAAGLAAIIPARRAASVDPLTVLKAE